MILYVRWINEFAVLSNIIILSDREKKNRICHADLRHDDALGL